VFEVGDVHFGVQAGDGFENDLPPFSLTARTLIVLRGAMPSMPSMV
jgi:hypothetical protein